MKPPCKGCYVESMIGVTCVVRLEKPSLKKKCPCYICLLKPNCTARCREMKQFLVTKFPEYYPGYINSQKDLEKEK